MTDIPNIRRRHDGSIDMTYYVEKGLSRRSEAAHEITDQTARKMRGVLVDLRVFGRLRTALQNAGLLSCSNRGIRAWFSQS